MAGVEDCEVAVDTAEVGVNVRSRGLVCWLKGGGPPIDDELKDEVEPERRDDAMAGSCNSFERLEYQEGTTTVPRRGLGIASVVAGRRHVRSH